MSLPENNQSLLKNITKVISFDRHGTRDVITHQSSEDVARNIFARALSKELHMNYQPCNSGIFTDSYNFIGIIPECTNVSVGYFNEHTNREYQNLKHLDQLLGKLLLVDFEFTGRTINSKKE